MPTTLVSVLLSGLGRDALRVAASLLVAAGIAALFAVASVLAIAAAFAGVPPPPPSPGAAPQPGTPSTDVVVVAWRYLGMPYAWGGASPATSFDCSGLVQWSYGQVGVRLPRTAQQQYDATARVGRDQLRPGDLVFFAHTYDAGPAEPITHVGIYVGGGQMINAPVEGQPIAVMPAFAGFWGAHYAGGGRPRG
jgi:cell wall-associated NlpC family hydrolase